MRAVCSILAVTMLALALGACGGKSSEEKAQTTVCDARDDIGKQVADLKALTPATVTTDAVRTSWTPSGLTSRTSPGRSRT